MGQQQKIDNARRINNVCSSLKRNAHMVNESQGKLPFILVLIIILLPQHRCHHVLQKRVKAVQGGHAGPVGIEQLNTLINSTVNSNVFFSIIHVEPISLMGRYPSLTVKSSLHSSCRWMIGPPPAPPPRESRRARQRCQTNKAPTWPRGQFCPVGAT